jgi:outer membrane lipoprotein-sorting protein
MRSKSCSHSRGLVAAVLLLLAPAGSAAPAPRRSGEVLAARLSRSGRAEATLERRVADPLTGRMRIEPGRLALEKGGRARVDFTRGGESVTLRPDGGEWLQPALKQMIRFGPESAELGLRWWSTLMDRGAGHEERALGGGRSLLVLRGEAGAAADSAWVTLGSDGLPRRLEIIENGGGRAEYRLSGWRFRASRGAAAFALRAPPGYEVVDMH